MNYASRATLKEYAYRLEPWIEKYVDVGSRVFYDVKCQVFWAVAVRSRREVIDSVKESVDALTP